MRPAVTEIRVFHAVVQWKGDKACAGLRVNRINSDSRRDQKDNPPNWNQEFNRPTAISNQQM
jgi:hypothetical protein